jgi:hypothetical protein
MTTFISYFFKIISMNSLLFTRPCHIHMKHNLMYVLFCGHIFSFFFILFQCTHYILRGSTTYVSKYKHLKINSQLISLNALKYEKSRLIIYIFKE